MFIVTCVVICSTFIWISGSFNLDNSLLKIDHANHYNDGWMIVSDDGETPVQNLSRDLLAEKGSVVLKNTLPVISDDTYNLCFRTDCEQVRVWADGEEIYSYGHNENAPSNKSFGVVWISVPMDSSLSGKEIRIELISMISRSNPGHYDFYLDQQSTVFVSLLSSNAFLCINSLLGISFSIMIIVSAFLHFTDGKRISFLRLYLGIFVFFCHLWLLSDTILFQFIFQNKAISYLITHSAFMLLPIPFLFYMCELFPEHRKQYHWIAASFCTYYLLRMLLYVLNIADLSDAVFITHLAIVAGVFYALSLNLHDDKSKLNKSTFAGLISFFVFVILAIIDFYLFPDMRISQFSYQLVMSLGIDVLLIAFYCAILKNHNDVEVRSLRFEHQAYTDAMTQVKNRAAFNVVMETLDAASYPRLTLFMVDLNNLKIVNDTMGHPAGDKLICALVHYLKNSFQNLGKIYRYGGDEFVIIIEDSPLKNIHEAHQRFDELIRQHCEEATYEISVAVGMASRQEPQNAMLHVSELLHLADMAMYHIKARQKSAISGDQLPRYHWMGQIDNATGILTFPAFKSRLYEALTTGENNFPCIVNFDLNFFDGYNNLFGWEAGNQLLQKLTTMATSISGKKGFCAHGEADSFWVFADVPNLDVLTRCISKEAKHFQELLGDCRLFPSFGIYCCTDTSTPVTVMCSRANSAKKEIKGHFDTLYAVYDPETHLKRIDDMRLTSYMQKGLDSDEFIPYFQPKYAADGTTLLGAEVLARWSQEPGSPISPAEFTSLFENSGLILALDWYMLDKACNLIHRHLEAGMKCVPISTNFSRLHVFEDDCIDRIRALLSRYNIPSELIEIELTETSFVESSDALLAFVDSLRAEGITVALDDFGSGLSSLGLLKKLTVDIIKIDRSLVKNSASGDMDTSIMKFIISLCRHLKIRTVAEGAETETQFEMVRNCGCDMIQGNYLCPALPEEEFETLLKKYNV